MIDHGAYTSDDPSDYVDGYTRSDAHVAADAAAFGPPQPRFPPDQIEERALNLALFVRHFTGQRTHALAAIIARELPAFLSLCDRLEHSDNVRKWRP